MLFLRTFLIFIFGILFYIPSSFSITWCIENDNSWSNISAPPFPYWSNTSCVRTDHIVLTDKKVAWLIISNKQKKEKFCDLLSGQRNDNLIPYFDLQKKYSGLNCKAIDNDKTIISVKKTLEENLSRLQKQAQNKVDKIINEKGKNKYFMERYSDLNICLDATINSGNKKTWNLNKLNYVHEAKRRGLDCGIEKESGEIKKDINPFSKVAKASSNQSICKMLNSYKNGEPDWPQRRAGLKESKLRNLDCQVKMLLDICTVYDGNIQKCMTHESLVKYINMLACKRQIYGSEKVILQRLKKDLKHRPNKYFIKASCFYNVERMNLNIKSSEIFPFNVSKNEEYERYYEKIRFNNDEFICAVLNQNKKTAYNELFHKEAKKRNLKCYSDINKHEVLASDQNSLLKMSNSTICNLAATKSYDVKTKKNGPLKWVNEVFGTNTRFVKEAKRRGLDCGVKQNVETKVANITKTQELLISTKELDQEIEKRLILENKLKERERKISLLEKKLKEEELKIFSDKKAPNIEIKLKDVEGKKGIISGVVKDNVKIAEFTIDDKIVFLEKNGQFNHSFFIPPDGVSINMVATDIAGLSSSKLAFFERKISRVDKSIYFDKLNPIGKRAKKNNNSIALIIGVEKYKNATAKALYADRDAKIFKDYATEKLGIPEKKIRTFINEEAEYAEILITIKDWIRRATKKNESDIYIFFAGHGLASDNGTNLFLLPYDGRPRLLEKTALLKDELLKEIAISQPRSVNVFLDTCYSGTTRTKETLVSSRRILVLPPDNSIPKNFTIFSAAAGDQTSKPLKETKHGMFSYFLMKGMEGEADSNNDNKITALELHEFVKENVIQQSSGLQTPQLHGDKDRVLVEFD